MAAASSVVSCRRREPLFESILGRFLSLNHRAMHADQVQVRVRVPPGQPLGRARQEQWLRAREKSCARRADKKISPTGFVLVANHTPNEHRTTTARTIFVSEAPQRAGPLCLEIGQIAGGLVRALRRFWSAIGRF